MMSIAALPSVLFSCGSRLSFDAEDHAISSAHGRKVSESDTQRYGSCRKALRASNFEFRPFNGLFNVPCASTASSPSPIQYDGDIGFHLNICPLYGGLIRKYLRWTAEEANLNESYTSIRYFAVYKIDVLSGATCRNSDWNDCRWGHVFPKI